MKAIGSRRTGGAVGQVGGAKSKHKDLWKEARISLGVTLKTGGRAKTAVRRGRDTVERAGGVKGIGYFQVGKV